MIPNHYSTAMNEENIITGFETTDYTDITDRSLITDISAALRQVSGKNREERQRRKIRAALVREHIGPHTEVPPLKHSRLHRFWKKLH